MTSPSGDTLGREKDKLFLTDAELIRYLGVPEKVARPVLRHFQATPGFPKKQKLWGDRWYRKAIDAYLDATCGVTMWDGAARPAAESRDRTRLPRHSHAEPMRRGIDDRQ